MTAPSPVSPSSPGAVLTGGRSSRFGRDKAVEPIGDRLMARIVVDALAGAGCDPVVLIGGDADLAAAIGRPVVADRWPGEGPLGGVITALSAFGSDVVVSACDLPGLDAVAVSAVIQAAAGDVDVAIAVDGYRHVPLACWNVTALDVLEARFAIGERSLRGVFDHLRLVAVRVDDLTARDVDTVADLPRVTAR